MKLRRLKIDGYKNLRSCDIEFSESAFINAIIGGNGSGKSNLIEALIHILIGCYFEKAPQFQFRLEYEAQNREVVLQREVRHTSVLVDGERMPLDHFARRLREGPAQVYYPELTLVYYSGECQRVKQLVARYRRQFQKLTRNPETDRYRPLFVQSSNEQSQTILLALFAHGREHLLKHLKLTSIANIAIMLRSPHDFDPNLHEPKLWNTHGRIRRIVSAFEETSSHQQTHKPEAILIDNPANITAPSRSESNREERLYHFTPSRVSGIDKLARRLEADHDNLYLALEDLRLRGMLRRVHSSLSGAHSENPFDFEQLSEGEKQLLAVVGAIWLTNQRDNLVLLDEPDTHLNPHWSWDYPSMLTEAFNAEQKPQSTVLMATHDPVMISGMVREQIHLAHPPSEEGTIFSRPQRNPRGQGVANLLCSSEFFGLPSSLDKGL